MAFIVPVMKKDYVLYNSAKAEARKKRANSNPLEIRRKGDSTPRISRLSCSVDIVGPSSPPTTLSSAPVTPTRGKNLRISIRRINSEADNLNSQLSQSAPVGPLSPQRHVRFGFCEEIEYNELDEEFIDSQPYTPTDKVPTPCLKRPNRTCALESTPVLKRNAVLKFVTFCASSKR
uniref:Uncharacterized protein n=1 Tax=Panagrolaimus superbus TaxID=310955 RepID=A0A914YNA9_9BILA